MDITKFFYYEKRELSSQSVDGNDSKRPREEINNSTSTPIPHDEVFDESLKSSDFGKTSSQLYAQDREISKRIIFTGSKK